MKTFIFVFIVWKTINTNSPVESFKENWSGKFPEFLSLTLKSSSNRSLSTKIINVLNGRNYKFDVENNLTSTPPQIMTFVFQFRSYFTKLEDDIYDEESKFETRPAFSRILPVKFTLDKIFDQQNIGDDSKNDLLSESDEEVIQPKDYTWELFAIVGYYGFHYMAFVRHEDEYYSCNDSNTK